MMLINYADGVAHRSLIMSMSPPIQFAFPPSIISRYALTRRDLDREEPSQPSSEMNPSGLEAGVDTFFCLP
jgi:hypothetical protein